MHLWSTARVSQEHQLPATRSQAGRLTATRKLLQTRPFPSIVQGFRSIHGSHSVCGPFKTSRYHTRQGPKWSGSCQVCVVSSLTEFGPAASPRHRAQEPRGGDPEVKIVVCRIVGCVSGATWIRGCGIPDKPLFLFSFDSQEPALAEAVLK